MEIKGKERGKGKVKLGVGKETSEVVSVPQAHTVHV